jgi:hypothetical protein
MDEEAKKTKTTKGTSIIIPLRSSLLLLFYAMIEQWFVPLCRGDLDDRMEEFIAITAI